MPWPSFHLPLFPLGVFLFPGEQTGLHIFEPRYRQLVSELENAMAEGTEERNRFGIPFHFDDQTASTGTMAKLIEVKKVYHGGRKDILIECIGHFETRSFDPISSPKLYPAGQVISRDIHLDSDLSPHQRAQVLHIKEILSGRDVDVSRLHGETLEDLTAWLGMSPAHKHKLLTAQGETRLSFIDRVLRWSLLILQQESQSQRGFFPN